MKHILNHTRKSSERYTLIDEGMGGYGEPKNSPNHTLSIGCGVDRGNGYQGYMAITYALYECDYLPDAVKERIAEILRGKGYEV